MESWLGVTKSFTYSCFKNTFDPYVIPLMDIMPLVGQMLQVVVLLLFQLFQRIEVAANIQWM